MPLDKISKPAMGIKNFMNNVKRHCSSEIYENCITLEELPRPVGKNTTIVAIDTTILLYKYIHASLKTGKDIHIVGFINRVVFYLNSKTLPVFIFDGKPPEEKTEVLKERKEIRIRTETQIESLEKKLEDTEDDVEKEDIKNQISGLRQNLVYVKKEHFDDVRAILRFLGVPYFDPGEFNLEGEAEHICATMQKKGIVDHVVSDDTDAFVFGATSVIRTSKKGCVQHIFLDSILQGFKMSMGEFIDFAILSGCDYCGTIPKVGGVGAYNAILKYKSIEKWLESKPAIINEDSSEYKEFLKKYPRARLIFKNNYEGIEEFCSKNTIALNVLKERELVSFLEKRQWKKQTINTTLKKIKAARIKYTS